MSTTNITRLTSQKNASILTPTTARKVIVTAAVLVAALVVTGVTQAKTLRWARAGDSLTLDPHAQNEGPTHALAHQMYEPLLHRDHDGNPVAALATEWGTTDDPNVWQFKLREGVKFHNGEDFNADDVVFSFKRAMKPNSAMKELLASITDVRKVDDLTVEMVTNGPNPLLPNNLTNLFIMDEGWTTDNGSVEPQNVAESESTYATLNTNGTGAFILESRKVDEKTVLKANPDYWGKGEFPLDVTEIIYTPIASSATRVAALLSGEVDFIQDVPVQDLARVDQQDNLKVIKTSQNRTIFFGMNVAADDLDNDNVDGKNPFADVRVREAMNMAINREAIQKVVMRGQSAPTGVIMPPFVNGWTEELDKYPAHDVAAAKSLMKAAGFEEGFSITLNCPNDRYINDEAICQAAVGMLGQIGIEVNLDAKPKAQHFPLITERTTDFYMLGWGVPTFDSEYIFNYLAHTTTDKLGSWNGTGFSMPELDVKIETLAAEIDLDKRNATIGDIWATLKEETIYLPIHNQILNWGMADTIEFPVSVEDQPHFKYLTFSN